MFNDVAEELTKGNAALLRSDNTQTKRRLLKPIAVAGIAMSLILPLGIVPRLMQAHELNQIHETIQNQLPAVSVTKVDFAPLQFKLGLPGTVQAILETPVYSRTNGYVKQRFADIGDRVNTGQLLAKMETPEVEDSEKEAKAQLLTTVAVKEQSEANRNRAQADLASAIAQLSQAKAALIERESNESFAKSTMQRWKNLGAEGAVSIQDVDEKETNYKTSSAAREAAQDFVVAAKSGVVAARARLKAEESNVSVSDANVEAATAHAARSSTERSFQNVVSPFAGVITERNVDQGTLISSGSDNSKMPLFRVARIDTVKVFVDVPQYAARGIRVGQDVDVTLKEFPGRIFTGKVARTSVALDLTARTLRTEIHIPNSDFALVPGMYADVNFLIPRHSPAFLIPANSLIVRAEGPQVVSLTKEKNVHYRQVKLGNDLGKQVEVLEGLNYGDTVVVNPSDVLAEGTAVSVSQ